MKRSKHASKGHPQQFEPRREIAYFNASLSFDGVILTESCEATRSEEEQKQSKSAGAETVVHARSSDWFHALKE